LLSHGWQIRVRRRRGDVELDLHQTVGRRVPGRDDLPDQRHLGRVDHPALIVGIRHDEIRDDDTAGMQADIGRLEHPQRAGPPASGRGSGRGARCHETNAPGVVPGAFVSIRGSIRAEL
jgi:hypothetical protein